ncbi:MAG: Na+/H+ antiporter subunit E [Marvinbryantia sp.]|jgi:multicomponent Na+:H+ antiporter subunit E
MLLLFFLVWLIFNGAVTTEIVMFGIVIAAVMFAFICKFMDYSIRKEILLLKMSGFFAVYVFQLIIEILRANLAVIRLILSQSEVAVPTMVSFRTTLKTKRARVILANSITLTPGTITVSLHDDELIVHCLDESMAEGMEDSIFVKMLERMEKIEKEGGRKWN